MQRTAHISLLGDNEIAREGLKRLLQEGGFRTECAPLDGIEHRLPDMEDEADHIVLIDTHSAEAAIELATLVRNRLQHARVVLLDAGCDVAAIRAALSQGLNGYLARHVSCLPLLLMLDLVALGETVLPRNLVEIATTHPQPATPRRWDRDGAAHGLSDRELSILRCLVEGDPNKVIARKLGITEATVKIHVKGILRKLHVLNRTQAAIWVVNQRLFEPAEVA